MCMGIGIDKLESIIAEINLDRAISLMERIFIEAGDFLLEEFNRNAGLFNRSLAHLMMIYLTKI